MHKNQPHFSAWLSLGTIIIGLSIFLILVGCAADVKTQALPSAKATAEKQDELDLIGPKLEKLGYSLESGSLVYYSSSATEIFADKKVKKAEVIVDKPISDFIIQADIDWTSTGDQAGCGIIFRADESVPPGSFYEYIIFSLAGIPAWDIYYYRDAKIQYSLFPYSQFIEVNDGRLAAVNTITLIVVGDNIETIYNTSKGVEVKDKKITSGQIVLFAWQESGETTCTFSNVWVWELNPKSQLNFSE